MKDVISVDTILAGVFLEGAEVPKTDNPGKDLDVYMERSEYHIPIAQAKLYSLLISKLPEKREHGDNNGKTAMPSEVIGFNKAVDDMHRVIDELFEVGDE